MKRGSPFRVWGSPTCWTVILPPAPTMLLTSMKSLPMKPSLVISACSPSKPSWTAMTAPEVLSGAGKTVVAPGLTMIV